MRVVFDAYFADALRNVINVKNFSYNALVSENNIKTVDFSLLLIKTALPLMLRSSCSCFVIQTTAMFIYFICRLRLVGT